MHSCSKCETKYSQLRILIVGTGEMQQEQLLAIGNIEPRMVLQFPDQRFIICHFHTNRAIAMDTYMYNRL